MTDVVQDLKYGIRMLARNPGFALIAILTLALGIGATTAIFGLISASLLKPMPYRNSDRLVLVWSRDLVHGEERDQVSATDVRDYRRLNHVFVDVATFADWTPILSGGDSTERLHATQVGDGFFRVLDAHPMIGRVFLPEEQQDGKDNVVVLSYELWRTRFNADPSIVGKTIALGLQPHVVVGVMPQTFRPLPPTLVEDGQLYRPVAESGVDGERSWRHLRAIARLRDGVSLQQAQAEMDGIATQLAQAYPSQSSSIRVRLVGLFQDTYGDVLPLSYILLGAVVLVLLIACANVANLLLARSAVRQREIAIRLAIGASRRRIVRQLLTESLTLAGAGGCIGLLLAGWSLALANTVGTRIIPQLRPAALDFSVCIFAVAISVLTAAVFGLAPALQISSPELNAELKGSSATTSARRTGLRGAMVVAELAMALVLLAGAGLLMKSFYRLLRVDTGFQTAQRVRMNIWLPYSRYGKPGKAPQFYSELLRRVDALPGISAAGFVSTAPFTSFDRRAFWVIGRQYAKGRGEEADAYFVTPGYLKAMGIALVRGRAFSDADDSSSRQVAILSESTAQRLWPGEDPIGKQICVPQNNDVPGPAQTVIGIVRDVKHYGLDRPMNMEVYWPAAQFGGTQMTLVVQTKGDPLSVVPGIREQLHALDPDVPIFRVEAMDQVVADSVLPRRASMLLLGTFAALALVLGCIGTYGLLSYVVKQRTREIGIRMALGARPRDVLKLVLGQGGSLAFVGIAAGALISLATGRLLRSLLFGVSAHDPQVLLIVAIALALMAALASYIPARRATRVDPLVALRYD